jgi:hypothetical protein
MLAKLPGWVVDDVTSIREEVADLRGLRREDLWRLAHLCSRDALWAVRAHPSPARVLDHQDPLPESTRAALARLRGQAGSSDAEP